MTECIHSFDYIHTTQHTIHSVCDKHISNSPTEVTIISFLFFSLVWFGLLANEETRTCLMSFYFRRLHAAASPTSKRSYLFSWNSLKITAKNLWQKNWIVNQKMNKTHEIAMRLSEEREYTKKLKWKESAAFSNEQNYTHAANTRKKNSFIHECKPYSTVSTDQ